MTSRGKPCYHPAVVNIHTLAHHRYLKLGLSLWLILAVLGHFAPGAPEPSAYVLCFGADGHVAVERAEHDHGHPDSPDLKQAAHDPAQISDNRSCVDIPLVGDEHGSHTPFPGVGKSFGEPAWAALAALCFVLLPFVRAAVAVFRAHSPPVADSRILLRRSVVLLI
ncbi:hypothetical protein ACWJKU_15260 [Methylocaldum sp. MU1018]